MEYNKMLKSVELFQRHSLGSMNIRNKKIKVPHKKTKYQILNVLHKLPLPILRTFCPEVFDFLTMITAVTLYRITGHFCCHGCLSLRGALNAAFGSTWRGVKLDAIEQKQTSSLNNGARTAPRHRAEAPLLTALVPVNNF